ncbi:MAG: UDP-N-acetylmuramate--L-alanine ligase [Sphingobacteriales bacterium]|nr:UDP-N-acetylmuramate--L-alanine ligase [Sphingobacteriales bacterium]
MNETLQQIIENIKRSSAEGNPAVVYFVGIGGIGMSALARYFNEQGAKVYGYDKTPTALTGELEKQGMQIHFEEDVKAIPQNVQLVVYTPAIPKEHAELVYFKQNNYPLYKRSEVLDAVTNSSFNICVAGTHGKTTITTMIAHILRHTGYGCNAFLGGIAVNYNSNFWSSKRNVCVAEADEYDRSFLRLTPNVAVITAMDADHLDIYGTAEAMEEAFIEFTGKIKEGGLLISKFGLKRGKELKASEHLTYSLQNESADVYATNIRMKNGSYEFDVMMKGWMMDNVELNMGGMHNVENSVVAIAVAHQLGIENEKIKDAVKAFRGVKRRFEYIVPPSPRGEGRGEVVYVDDYAHHPEELRALISGAKSLFSDKKCTVIFQPHLYTRTRDLAEGFAESLDLADEIILLPIYPARELPIEGVSSETILDKMKNGNKQILSKADVLKWVNSRCGDTTTNKVELLITAGAGDIDTLIEPIKNILSR